MEEGFFLKAVELLGGGGGVPFWPAGDGEVFGVGGVF